MTTYLYMALYSCFFFFQAEDGIRDLTVTGVQTCALPISTWTKSAARMPRACTVRNCFQVGPVRRGAGSIPVSCRICHTVEAAMGWPSLTSSPCTRRCPHVGLSVAMQITSLRMAAAVGGRPGLRQLV